MSQPKFAPITAALLARKGSAIPSTLTSFSPPPPKAAAVSSIDPPLATAMRPEAPHAEHDAHLAKKLFVALTRPEHERLAIAAVKTGLTRHQIVRDALDLYYEQLSRDMGNICACVAGTCGQACQ